MSAVLMRRSASTATVTCILNSSGPFGGDLALGSGVHVGWNERQWHAGLSVEFLSIVGVVLVEQLAIASDHHRSCLI